MSTNFHSSNCPQESIAKMVKFVSRKIGGSVSKETAYSLDSALQVIAVRKRNVIISMTANIVMCYVHYIAIRIHCFVVSVSMDIQRV